MVEVGLKLIGDGLKPNFMTQGAACADCYSAEDITIQAHTRHLVKLGFALELPKDYEAIIRPRSGLSRKGIDIAIGTIDSDFKGELSANVINNTESDFVINKHDRICQIAFRQIEEINLVEVDELSSSDRGANGFGSTGI